MNPGEEAVGAKPQPAAGLDDGHGGARIVLPEIDPAALGKAAVDTAPLPSAWFELGVTGENMIKGVWTMKNVEWPRRGLDGPFAPRWRRPSGRLMLH